MIAMSDFTNLAMTDEQQIKQDIEQAATECTDMRFTEHYSYSPSKCMSGGVSQMRFELGDTSVEGGRLSSALSDEEYSAILAAESNWKKAKMLCLKAILMRLSYEVDTSIDGLSYSLSQRAERWQSMYDKLKQELSVSAPPSGTLSRRKPPAYFHADMHANRRK